MKINNRIIVLRILLITVSIFAAGAPGADAIPSSTENLSPFGIGSSAARSRDLTKWIPQMADIGITVMRAPGGTGWGNTDRPAWDKLDEKIAYLAEKNFTTGGMFYSYRVKGGGFPMDELPGWSAYVKGMVGHCKGKIKYWEVWNEPPNGTHNAPASDYAKLVIAAYDAAKAADPDCLVGIAAKSVDVNYLDQAIAAGAKGHFDYITLHPYETLGSVMSHAGTESMYMSTVPTIRKMLAARDPAKANAPVWFTEIGFDSKRGAEKQAKALIEAYTMGIAQGVTVINWFEGMDGDSGPMGLIDNAGKPRPAYTAMAEMIKLLGPHPTYLGWVMLNEKDYAFMFQGVKGTAMVCWAPKGTTDKFEFGEPTQMIDPLSGKLSKADSVVLTESPIFIDGVPNKLVSIAKANRPKPYPWDGDFTGAKSVSVSMGEKNIEKGLHTKSADSVAADVVAYGGSARAGTIPGGNVFMVDPNFLSYTATPIEIDIVCRRNPKNDPATLKLEYESTTGFKKAEPFEIPDTAEWHTARWKITDSQFVSMYGFNFRLDSGKYFVKSVTVTKVSD